MRVFLSGEAERNLEAIGDRIAADSPAHALNFVRSLRAKCIDLAQFPLRFPLVDRYASLGIRRRVRQDYLIFYRVELDEIMILHILHCAMDYEVVLFPQSPS